MSLLATIATALSLLAPAPQTVVAAGDSAACGRDGDEQTAALVARIPGTVAILGDAVYERGTEEEFANCYSWARFRGRTRAALGNHEYYTADAAPARAYFGLPARGWYAYRLGTWDVIVLNSNCGPAGGCGEGSPQERWLRLRLRTTKARCTLAYWHHARWSSGLHGSDLSVAPLWRALAQGRADVVLAAHDHHYERFRPIRGIRSFVVGTGGRSIYPVLRPLRWSAAVYTGGYGVLRLTLRERGYGWSFVPVGETSFRDAGTGSCR